MAAVERYELLVVGAGTAGKTLAAELAAAGRRVAVIERVPEMVGGTCINLACIPSKTVIRSAEVAELARRSGALGVDATLAVVDPAAILERKRAVVQSMRESNRHHLQASGAELIFGNARFVAPRRVEVTTGGSLRVIEGEHAVLNLGTRPALPDIDGLAQARPLTSESLLEFRRIPQRLLVLGGGYVGIELGQAMQRLGARVTIVERGPQLLAGEDADIAVEVARLLREDGVEIHLGTRIERVARASSGDVRVEVVREGHDRTFVADDVLVALGRTPNSQGVGLDDAGVEVDDRGFVRVDERLRTSAERTYAVGDITGGPQFTHVSFDDQRVVLSDLQGGDRTTRGRLVPYCVFIDPELGRVGLTEREARAAGHDVRIARMPAAAVPRAGTLGATRGMFKAVVERGSERILGAAILGAHGGEVIAAIQMAMLGGLTAGALRDGILTHPTMAEGLNELFSSWVE
jgi:pyruvate/2-oxoglutarate dehydrogenase complex dihydrolipoamide dehydrogenase (E3) component